MLVDELVEALGTEGGREVAGEAVLVSLEDGIHGRQQLAAGRLAVVFEELLKSASVMRPSGRAGW
jgi:hypothetical protein